MKHLIAVFGLMLIAGGCSTAAAQQAYTSDQVDYKLELPSPVWRAISEPDAVHEHAEFVNGDRLDGYLQIRKEVVDAGSTPSALARRDPHGKRDTRPVPRPVVSSEECG